MLILRRLQSGVRRHGIVVFIRRLPGFVYWRYRYEFDHARWDRLWGTETSRLEHEYLDSMQDPAKAHAAAHE